MIECMHRMAKAVFPFRKLLLLIFVLLALWLSYIVISNSATLSVYLLPCLALLGWVCCLYGIAEGFIRKPSRVSTKDGFFKRLAKRIKFGVAWVLALLIILTTFGLFYLSYMSFRMALL